MERLDPQHIASLNQKIRDSIPQLSINTVIFRFHKMELEFAAMQLKHDNMWLVPGGYIFQNESTDEAAKRNLLEQTKINDLVFHQFGTFGSQDRRLKTKTIGIEQMGLTEEILSWITQRFVTIGYYSILSGADRKLEISPLYHKAAWIKIDDKNQLAMDHALIVAEARKAIAKDLQSKPLLLSFLPDQFTIPELQRLYEVILGRKIDRGNFRKRMLKSGFLVKTGQVKANTSKRPPDLYRIHQDNYLNELSDEVKFGF